MLFEKALELLRDGDTITRINNKYAWSHIEIYEDRLLAVYLYKGALVKRKELKIFGKAFLDNNWIRCHVKKYYNVEYDTKEKSHLYYRSFDTLREAEIAKEALGKVMSNVRILKRYEVKHG